MALILPNAPGSSSNGLKIPKSTDLILPGKTSQQDAYTILDKRNRIAKATSEAGAAAKEASDAENAASFLKVLGNVGKEIGQSTARSVALVGSAGIDATDPRTSGEVFSRTITPESNFSRAVFGDKPFSITKTGEEISPLLEKFGVSPETAKRLAPFSGSVLVGLDVFPGGAGKKQLFETAIKDIAVNTEKAAIATTLKKIVKGDDAAIQDLAEMLTKVDKPNDVRGIIKAVTDKSGSIEIPRTPLKSANIEKAVIPEQMKVLADQLVGEGFSKEEFLAKLGRALESEDPTKLARGQEIMTAIREAGFTPGKFYDAAHGRPITKGGVPGVEGLRKVGLGPSGPKMITRAETTILRERIQNLARGFREGAQDTRGDIAAVQKEVENMIKDGLPPTLRGRLLTTLRSANAPEKLDKALTTVEAHIDAYASLRAEARTLSTARSKIGYIRKIGEFNQAVVNDIKRQLNILKPLKKMNENELNQVFSEIVKRFEFKKERGAFIKTQLGNESLPPDFYAAFATERPNIIARGAKDARNIGTSLKEGAEDVLGVISTRLGNIAPELKHALRRFEFDVRQTTHRDAKIAEGFAKKTKSLSPEEFTKLDVAMKNGAIKDVEEIAKAHGFTTELKAIRNMLDDVYRRAHEVKLDVGYRQNYFPRSFKKDKASTQRVIDYYEQVVGKGILQKALDNETLALGRPLTDIEKTNTINSLLRGYKRSNISLSKTGSLKGREIEAITPEINASYEDSVRSLFRYVEATNNLIESRRFFGKHLDLKGLDSSAKMDDVIGAYVNNLIGKGKLTTENQLELQRILAARFSGKQMSPWLGALKDVGYLAVMNSFKNAITQMGDLAFAFYRNGAKNASLGVKDALSSSKISKEDIGIATEEIAGEYGDPSVLKQSVNTLFKYIGLNKMDRLGKETFINGVHRTLQDEVRADAASFSRKMHPIFGAETPAVMNDLRNGTLSENVKYLIFNELLDFQPVSLSEVPLKYLEAPNGRIAYALKTYTIKLFDVYRREVYQQMKTNPKQGVTNLLRLTGYLTLFNAAASEIKNYISGKETSWSDNTVNAIANAYGVSPYLFGQAKQEGIGRTLLSQAIPVTQLPDDLGKDIMTLLIDKQGDVQFRDFKTVRDFPAVGNIIYDRYGGGSPKPKKKSSSSAGIQIPSATVPSIEIPSIRI